MLPPVADFVKASPAAPHCSYTKKQRHRAHARKEAVGSASSVETMQVIHTHEKASPLRANVVRLDNAHRGTRSVHSGNE